MSRIMTETAGSPNIQRGGALTYHLDIVLPFIVDGSPTSVDS